MSFLGPGPHLPHFVLCIGDRRDRAFLDAGNILAEGLVEFSVAQLDVLFLLGHELLFVGIVAYVGRRIRRGRLGLIKRF